VTGRQPGGLTQTLGMRQIRTFTASAAMQFKRRDCHRDTDSNSGIQYPLSQIRSQRTQSSEAFHSFGAITFLSIKDRLRNLRYCEILVRICCAFPQCSTQFRQVLRKQFRIEANDRPRIYGRFMSRYQLYRLCASDVV
jgi:hypothetical protein